MASVTPVTQGTTGYVPQGKAYGGVVASDEVMTVDGSIVDLLGCSFLVKYFTGVNDADVWDFDSTDPPPPHPVAAFWMGDDVDADKGTLAIKAVGRGSVSIRFDLESASTDGFVLVFYKT